MFKIVIIYLSTYLFFVSTGAQVDIPFDTTNWNFEAEAYIMEHYKGKDAIYLHNGNASLKTTHLTNGRIEFDIYLTERQAFPGVYFRSDPGDSDRECFYFRPHLSGKEDGNQAISVFKGISAWQIYFGPAYSFAYDYNFDDWTHVRIDFLEGHAQIYLDYSENPQLTWELKHAPRSGEIILYSSLAPMHFANFQLTEHISSLQPFHITESEPVERIIKTWTVSDKFEESVLSDPEQISSLVDSRIWDQTVQIDETSIANLSRVAQRYGSPGNTVFARLDITADRDQLKLFEFGYSDRVVVILNGQPIYKGNNRWRSRDYRYLGTVGLFDAVYLDLKRGANILLVAVSEDFGGWAITGRLSDYDGVELE